MNLNFFGMTDIGQKRETNQDVFYTYQFSERMGFAIVCDGMGGQSGGHIASNMACTVVSEALVDRHIETADAAEIKEKMITALSEANVGIYQKSNLEPGCKGMGTTAVLAVVSGDTAYIAHIGDSRAYLLSESGLHQITCDHSLVQELLAQGKISEEEAPHHPNKNMITRAVGVNITVDIDYLELPLEPGQKLLLCTDGLTNMLSDEEIEKVLRTSADSQEACQTLIRLANEAGGFDNITAVIIG